LLEVAEVDRGRAYTSISRRDGRRTVQVTSGVEPFDQTSVVQASLEASVLPSLVEDYPGLSYSFEGFQADIKESMSALIGGFVLAMIISYALLAIPFRSYAQPLVVMMAIPFGIVGAVLGHLLMGYSMSIISLMGIIALSGVVVNDSLILIDYANKLRREGLSAEEAVHRAGVRRFRPILLTTMTTYGGLAPMIFETSRQARFMIPMAISLGYGIVFATLITLVLVPSLYLLVEDFQAGAARVMTRLRRRA
ncbi:MAG: efflux RND transporter permease subunit, partial [Gemmatimonadota bacterium]